MNNNINKLPDNFSVKVMAELGKRIERRERKKGKYITALIMLSITAVLLTGALAVIMFYPQVGIEIKNYYMEFINSMNSNGGNTVAIISLNESLDNVLNFISNNVMLIICLVDFGILYLFSNILSKHLNNNRV
ncbi:MAG: hypothetical protein Q4C26_07110 [Bacteroidales bacterium]|nr:hypothetical protein [Bacteroidales bacterium]